MMDAPATLQKCPASLALTAEACQPTLVLGASVFTWCSTAGVLCSVPNPRRKNIGMSHKTFSERKQVHVGMEP